MQFGRSHRQSGRGRIAVGLTLSITFWIIAWSQTTPLAAHTFFPLWLGYILTVDGLCSLRGRTSLLQRAGPRWPLLFALSIPVWWLFEALNLRLDNWHYLGTEGVSSIEYAIRASIAFSTVIPAVITTSELIDSFEFNLLRRLGRLEFGSHGHLLVHLTGWVMLILMLIWPQYFFPFCWISVFFIADPIATRFGARTLSSLASEGRWKAAQSLALGALICGFFWEFWNYYAMPKWQYDVPFVSIVHVFEMPILGYGGYIPFAFELYTFVILVRAMFPSLGLPQPLPQSTSRQNQWQEYQ